MATLVKKIYLLGDYSLYPDSRQFDCKGKPIHLQSRPFQVLLYLIENRHRAVSRAELLNLFWEGREVYDLALTKCLGAIRKALDDSTDDPRFIETLYGGGYRYIGPFEETAALDRYSATEIEKFSGLRMVTVDKNSTSAPLKSETASPARPSVSPWSKRSARTTGLGLLLLTLAITGATLAYLLRPGVESGAKPIDFIAVMPLRNLTGDPAQEYFSDGLTESLITELSRIDGLKIVSRGSAFAFKGEKVDPQEVGRRLGVAAVLEGSVQKSGERIRVDVRLVSTHDGQVLWAGNSYDRSLEEIFVVQDEIRRSVAGSLSLALRGAGDPLGRKRQTSSVEAHQAYLKGRYHWYKRTGENLHQAIEQFEQAILKDPEFALAYAGLAETYAVMESNSIVPPGTATPKARLYANKALELDNTLASAYAALGLAENCEWKWQESVQMFKQALQLNPNCVTALHWQATTLMALGRFDDAEIELKQAQELDLLSLPIAISLWENYFYSRQIDRCLAQAETMIALFPDNKAMYWRLGLSYMQKGMYEQALDAVSKSNDTGGMRALVLAFAGRRGEARQWVERIVASSKNTNDPFFIAVLYSALGEKEEAFSWLEKSHASRQANLVSLNIDPVFDPLRSDPRFDRLIQRVGLAD
jgi:TolB-like protein/DNA-binding winged helix-turn-helix (wHTH) protein/cytochrome c-type biogenesis protein CcmH/NrfG